MAAIHLHYTSDVGTTYKRALDEFLRLGTLASHEVSGYSPGYGIAIFTQQLPEKSETVMRKPRDYDAELKALNDKARSLTERRLRQLGELVIATSADRLPPELLAGALLAATETTDAAIKEGWRERGAAFFQRAARGSAGSLGRDAGSKQANGGGAQPPAGEAGA